jgi:hypothetical protein
MSDNCREAFEKWADGRGLGYGNMSARPICQSAWQASRAAFAEEVIKAINRAGDINAIDAISIIRRLSGEKR